MAMSSHLVKGTFECPGVYISQVDVNSGGIDGFMAHKGLNGEQIRPIFIQVSGKGVAEGMGSKPVFPSQAEFMLPDMGRHVLAAYGDDPAPASGLVGREKPVHGPAAGEPVLCKDIQGIFREDCIAVRSGFCLCDVNTHGRTAHIRIPEMPDFTGTQTGRVHE